MPATTVRKGKRKRVALAHLRDDAGSSDSTKKSTARSKKKNAAAGRPAAGKKKTVTKGKSEGKVVQKKTKGRGKGKRKKKAAMTETPDLVSSTTEDNMTAPADDTVGGGGQEGLRVGSLGIARADVIEQVADAQLSPEGGPSTIGEEQLRLAQRTMDIMAVAAARMTRLPNRIGAVLFAFADERTELDTECVEGAAAGPGDGAGGGG